jgi:hypothetical protein
MASIGLTAVFTAPIVPGTTEVDATSPATS